MTTDNEAGLATGWLDGRLSERGRALATELGRRRRNDGVVAVFCSDLGRAAETVEVAFDGSGIPVHPDARLRECDYGAWNGLAVAQLERERTQRISQPFPGGESYLQVVARVGDFLEGLARDWDGARVVVVGDSLGLGPPSGRRCPLRPGSGAVRLAGGLVLHLARRLALDLSLRQRGCRGWCPHR